MDITQINTSLLRNLLKLSERKEALLLELSTVESEIEAVTSGKAPKASAAKVPAKAKSATREAKPVAPAVTGRRGAVKEKIIALLNSAGSDGAGVKELAVKLGLPPQNVHVWFSSTGKKLGLFEKVKPGHFRIKKK